MRSAMRKFITLICIGVMMSGVVNAEDKVVASVNGTKITKNDVAEFLKTSGATEAEIMSPEADTKGREALIQREILSQESSKENVISKDDLSKKVSDFITSHGGDEKLKQVLAASGSSIEALKKSLATDILIKEYIDSKIAPHIKVTDGEIKVFYDSQKAHLEQEQVKARHILINSKPEASKEDDMKALEKIKVIKSEIDSGKKDFSTAAKEYSDCPSKAQGGDLGFFSKGMMVKPFEDVAFSQEIGKVSEPVKTQFGYHLIVVDEKKQDKTDLQTLTPQITEFLTSQKIQKAIGEKIDALMKTASIERL